jgi:hypothetical protein
METLEHTVLTGIFRFYSGQRELERNPKHKVYFPEDKLTGAFTLLCKYVPRMTYNIQRKLTSGMELLQNVSECKLRPAEQAGSLDPSDLSRHRC